MLRGCLDDNLLLLLLREAHPTNKRISAAHCKGLQGCGEEVTLLSYQDGTEWMEALAAPSPLVCTEPAQAH